jgi:molecular chaperone Hsp33
MPDGLARMLAADETLRGLATITTDLVEDARRRHATLPTATAALGRALTAALLLGATLKDDWRISLQFNGDGPIGGILADATPDGRVRGFVTRPATHLPPRNGKLDVGGALGQGTLCVMRVPPVGGVPYRSVLPLVSGEIGEDVASFLAVSDQTPSVVGVGVFVEPDGRVGAAGGYLVQAMPGAEASTLEAVERNVRAAPPPTELVRAATAPSEVGASLFAGLGAELLDVRPVVFACRCSRERVEAAIVALGRAELDDVLSTERRVGAVCEFCAARYIVDEPELRALRAAAGV